MPRVSVVIPTFNRADVLQRAIDSVLAQTVDDLECIVVDDASTDRTPNLVAEYDDPRLHYVPHAVNRGGSAARNTGIDVATGDYVAFLDSDDTWRPRKLERQLAELESRSDEWVGAYCDAAFTPPGAVQRAMVRVVEAVDDLGPNSVPAEGGTELIKHVLADDLHTSGGSTLIVERSVVEAIDGFDESFERFQDPEFIIRVLREGNLAYVPETLVDRYESANPPAEAVRAADRHYLETFSETVERLEASGHPIRESHELMLARQFFAEGKFGAGLSHLRSSGRLPFGDPAGVLLSVASGVRTRVVS